MLKKVSPKSQSINPDNRIKKIMKRSGSCFSSNSVVSKVGSADLLEFLNHFRKVRETNLVKRYLAHSLIILLPTP